LFSFSDAVLHLCLTANVTTRMVEREFRPESRGWPANE
jgi:hypothetical protein